MWALPSEFHPVCLDEGLEPFDSVSPSGNRVFLEEYLPPYVASTGDDQGTTQPCFQGTSTMPGSPGASSRCSLVPGRLHI